MNNYKYIFSVIIPTYDRLDEIQELLESLKIQSLEKEKFEVLIVDDGSTDKTEEYISKLLKENILNIRFFKQDHKGPGPARNLGMKNAHGEYFIFVDSDCIANESWLKAYEKVVSKEKVAGFGGPDKVLPNFSPLQKAIDYSMTSFITTGGMRGHSKKKISKYYPRSFNMGVRADVVEKIGGMNKLRHGQDIEFAHRMISTGGKVVKVLDAIVYHKRRSSIRKFFKQVFNWGVARINLFKIDKGMLELIHFFPLIGTLVTMLIIVLFCIFPNIFLPLIVAGFLLLFGMAIHGIFKYSDWRVLLYIPIIVPLQIFGYGIGFGFAFIKRVIFRKDEFTGFVKDYYK